MTSDARPGTVEAPTFPRLMAEGLAVGFLGLIAAIASLTGANLVFFPELGALAYDVFSRPRGTWAKSPIYLALTPAVTAALGVACARHFPYGVASMLIVVSAAIATVRMLRSPIAPAISAGVLALVMGIKSWWYPPSILVGTTLLGIAAPLWRTICRRHSDMGEASGVDERPFPRRRPPGVVFWIPVLLGFIMFTVMLVEWSGLRFIVFPPLVVLAYEMFTRPTDCPWARRPWLLPVTCTLTATFGVAMVALLGPGVVATLSSLTIGIVVLRLARLHIPPALAVALIPQVLHEPDLRYAISVGIGTVLLAGTFLVYRGLLLCPLSRTSPFGPGSGPEPN